MAHPAASTPAPARCRNPIASSKSRAMCSPLRPIEVRVLDLSRLASEYGRHIHPCKACFSTAAALCHWPCSCYPNYSLGQTHDWMNEIYPMWVAAHGIMIVTPVNWYQVSSPLKLMMDRLVCADGGNPDPTRTLGKNARLAKQIELDGWDYPRHLTGRLFAVVVHGDVEGAENVRRSISDWLCFMHLCPAGPTAELDRYYWKPYATSHAELDADTALQEEVRNAARALRDGVRAQLAGKLTMVGEDLHPPRQKWPSGNLDQDRFCRLRMIWPRTGSVTVFAALAGENHCTSRLPLSGHVLRWRFTSSGNT